MARQGFQSCFLLVAFGSCSGLVRVSSGLLWVFPNKARKKPEEDPKETFNTSGESPHDTFFKNRLPRGTRR